MRARGANVTDIAVIVVAANDGVMPQTEEAISHAKAAGVSIVVAINKVDLPDANLRKTEQQLYSLDLLPDTMGGDVMFVQTSAKTGKGIDELLDSLALVAEMKELKANPDKAATGTCLEAYLSEKEGVQATLLVQEGTLRPGDVVLCGAAAGVVRRMYNDQGRTIDEAGPSVPVRIIGLDSVPNADDPFLVVPDLGTARQIADDRKARAQLAAQTPRAVRDLASLQELKVTELKVILKAEARGSIEAIRNELGKLRHEEVRVRILHAAIGGINVSDVQLALTSPEDTLILGFNVVPDNEAKQMAEKHGIKIHEYDIIYKLAEDIRAALEGKLKPREEFVHLGRANVRQTFKISRAGTIAGCVVTQGTIERSAKVRVIRGGVVVYPAAEKTAGLESLKRFKEDVREVREGFECGIKIAGYDDIKVDDVIECYRIEQVQRSLS
jgi:translation initiation factor IF-2